MITLTKYVRKPLYVDAVQVTEENFADVAEWCSGEVKNSESENPHHRFIAVKVTNPMNPRQSQAKQGDWILYTKKGYKVYTPRAFHSSFDAAPAEEQLSDQETLEGLEVA